jgi:hypothetical protein
MAKIGTSDIFATSPRLTNVGASSTKASRTAPSA